MNDRMKLITGLSAFAFIFLVSLIIFKLSPDDIKYRVLFFPADETNRLIGETRRLKDRGKLEKDAEILLREILLGPSVLEHNRYIPRGTKLQSVMLRDSVLYVDYSVQIQQLVLREVIGNPPAAESGKVMPRDMMPLGLAGALGVVQKTIKFNFPLIRQVVFTINGEIPAYGEIPDNAVE
ncbi:MAG: GerMN domain-containing protein [Spirochaetales bacterium]|nr:GerMN domain-containing protein [Spirochaetales bacterium]